MKYRVEGVLAVLMVGDRVDKTKANCWGVESDTGVLILSRYDEKRRLHFDSAYASGTWESVREVPSPSSDGEGS